MAQSKARALRQARIGHTPEYIRLVKQRQAISRMTIHIRYNKEPITLHRYNGQELQELRYKVTARPRQGYSLAWYTLRGYTL